MATKKSDAFFLRGSVTTNGSTIVESTIDLGAFVDALGQSVLRIHNLQVEWNATGTAFPYVPSTTVESLTWNLRTQKAGSALVNCTDKSLVSSGSLFTAEEATGTFISVYTETSNINPMHWTHGYLIATDNIYLSVNSLTALSEQCDVCIIMECTVERLSKEAALALALSQQ